MNFLSYRSVRFFLTLILAWAVLPTFAAVSPYCPAQPLSVANGGSVTSANLASCDGPFDFGMGIVPAELPVHGTITLAAQGPASSQFVTYTHSGNSATSDTFKLEDENGDLLTFTVTITPPTSLIVVTPVSLPTLTAGTLFSQTLTSTGGTAPYTYTHTGGALPPGVTLSSGGVLSGTPTQRGGYSFSVTSQDSLGALAVKGYTGTVQNPSLSITPAVATAIQGAAFSQTLTAAGGVAPHTYLLEPPNPFPAGITVSTAGVVSGTTSAAAGNYLVTLRVTESSTGPGSYFELETFTVTVSPPPSVSIAVTPASVSEDGATNLTFTVTRSLNLSSPTTVNITTSGTATSGVDYVGGVATVVIPANATTATITLNPTVDGVVEPDETVILTVAAGTGYTVGAPASATGTILNDDVPTATIAVSPAAVAEDGAANLVYTVTLNSASATALNINFTVGGTAANGTDYATIASPLVIPAGSTTGTITVNPTADATNEADETVSITLAAGSGYTVGVPNSATGTILNDDLPNLTITDVTVTEGNAGITNATFTVSLSAPAGPGGVTFDIATANGTATGGVDFVAQNSTGQTILPGSSTYTFTVLVNGDTLNEPTETFLVNVTNVTNAVLVDGQGVGTITNDDPLPMLAIIDATVTEGNSGTTNAVFTVALSAASGQTVTFNYATADGTATAPSDYASTSGSLAFTPGQTTQKIFVPVVGDTVNEADETFFVNLSGAVNATIADNQGVGTITNDDAPPTISIGNASVAEGNSGTASATFTVSLSGPSAQTVTVNYATADGTAVASSDYVAAAGTVTFNPGITTQTVTVLVNGDTTFEANETFTVNLSGATNAAIVGGTGTGTITNDDTAPVLSITNASVTEGNVGTTTATFALSLSSSSGQTTTVNYATANGTATAGVDYVAASGTLNFAPGQTTQVITVTVNGDTLSEANETFTVTLSAPNNATIGVGTGTGTINDDDALPTLTINDVSATEGNSGTANAAFTVTLSAASGQTVTVNYATADGTATAPGDYTTTSGTVTFAPGQTTQTITVPVVGDALNEANETFFVNLSGAVNATIVDNQGLGTITNDDTPPTISIGNVTVVEGNSGTTSATFTVSLSGPSAQTVTVNYATADGTAVAGSDYVAASGTVTFNPGITTQSVNVLVNGDTTFEANETFTVNLSSPTNATIVGGTGTGTISNDDTAPVLSVNNASVTEGNVGTTTATFTVSLSAASGLTTTVNYATADGTATAGIDYVAASGTLTFAPGQTTQSIAVTVNGDTLSEANETFTVTLSAPSNATIGVGTGTGTINDDDPLPALSINGASVTEGNAGTVNAVFTVSMSAASGQSVSVGYATTNATALAGSDYVAASGTLTFTPGQTTQQIQVVVNGDIVPEANETFSVVLSAPVNATIATGTGIGTITNDDVPVTVSPTTVPSATVAMPYSQTLSGSGGSGPYTFAVTAGALPAGLSLAPGGSLSGTPTAGGTFTFTATATDSSPAPGPFTGSQAYTLVVAAPTIVLPATTLTAATIGTSYSATLDAATGGTATYSYGVTGGALPAGVTLSSATRALSGTPTQAGAFSFTVTATDSSTGTGPYTGTQTYSLVVGAPTIVVNPATLPNAQVGVAINQAITASGGTATYSYAVTAGALPANVTLSATGALAGAPTTAGVYNFTVTATDSSTGSGSPFTGSRAYTLTIAAALPGAPAIATAVAGSAQITLTVTAPLDTGGDTITGYSATCTPTPSGAAVTATSTTTTIVVNGLANGTNYTCTASAINSAGTGAASAPTATLSPVLTTYTGPTATSSGNATVTLTGGGSSCSFAPFGTGANESAFFIPLTGHPKSPPSTSQFPPNVRFPYGLLDFVLVGCTPGGTVSLSVTYPGSEATGAQYWKYGPTPSSSAATWYTLPAAATGNTFTFSITDGGLGDDDLTPNGTIVDQGGPGVTAPPVPVPTNNDWLLLAFMSALLGFSAVLQSRRSKRRQLKGPVCSC